MSDAIFWILANLGVNVVAAAVIAVAVVFVLRNAVKTSIEEGVKFGFSKALEEHKAQLTQEIEAAKTSLKFSETRFSKQFEALVALRRYFRRLLPKKSHPDMEWDEAMERVADRFSKHLDELEEFLFAHEAVLPTPVLERLEQAINKATDAQFEFDWNSKDEEAYARPEAIKLANGFYDDVKTAVEGLQKTVDAQMPARRV
jgi:hypothetical protein